MKVKLVAKEVDSHHLNVGEVYEVLEEDGVCYIVDRVGDNLFFDLTTGKCSWHDDSLDETWYAFEEVKEQPYTTSPEVLAQVLRKMANNVENGLRPKEGIQVAFSGSWLDGDSDAFGLSTRIKYRVKPETITLKNGIEVPKPLPLNSLKCYHKHREVFFPVAMKTGYNCIDVSNTLEEYAEEALFYLTEEEAIEASKALFGLDIKDV